MDDIENNLLAAWEKVLPIVRRDPAERAKRLQRRGNAMMRKPPRAWCLAVRANDHRIDLVNAASASLTPELGTFEHAHDGSTPAPNYREQVLLDTELLELVCQKRRLHPIGEAWFEAAPVLGVGYGGFRHSRSLGRFGAKYVKGLAGRRGKPTPILMAGRELDPGARDMFNLPDEIWGASVRMRFDRLPGDVAQWVQRVPVYHSTLGKTIDGEPVRSKPRGLMPRPGP